MSTISAFWAFGALYGLCCDGCSHFERRLKNSWGLVTFDYLFWKRQSRCNNCRFYKTPPCCIYPLPLNRLQSGRGETEEEERDGPVAFISRKYRSLKFSTLIKKTQRNRGESDEWRAGNRLNAVMAPWVKAVSKRYGVGKLLLVMQRDPSVCGASLDEIP